MNQNKEECSITNTKDNKANASISSLQQEKVNEIRSVLKNLIQHVIDQELKAYLNTQKGEEM